MFICKAIYHVYFLKEYKLFFMLPCVIDEDTGEYYSCNLLNQIINN